MAARACLLGRRRGHGSYSGRLRTRQRCGTDAFPLGSPSNRDVVLARPPLGLALVAWLTQRVFPGTQGSGIPQTIAALSISNIDARNRLLSIRIATGKLFLTLAALASGASIGREGPTVQIGASIMHSLRRFTRFSVADIDRGLILAGGAAGIAAAFNTPLAGVVFAIEELSRSFEERTSGTIYTAVIVAGVTSVALVGNYTYFGSTQASLTDSRMWLVVPVCGFLGGIAGGVFSRCMLVLRRGLYFSGVVQAPLTALVIVSEMTGNRELTLPLMAVTLIGRGASALICRESLYRALAVAFIETVSKPAADITPQAANGSHH